MLFDQLKRREFITLLGGAAAAWPLAAHAQQPGKVPRIGFLGGNITGQSFFSPELAAKRIELLKELMPQMTRVAVLVNPSNPGGMGAELQAMETAAQSLKIELKQLLVRGPHEFESAFEQMQQVSAAAVAISDDGMLIANIIAIAALAMKRRFVSIGNKEFAQAGGLMGYGVNFFATFHRAAVFVDRILKGAKPADIPIEQATKFAFVINLATAKALGLDVPPTLLARADEVIE
jgi:ABC-type uncharacterized transport system substrate-binding protein